MLHVLRACSNWAGLLTAADRVYWPDEPPLDTVNLYKAVDVALDVVQREIVHERRHTPADAVALVG